MQHHRHSGVNEVARILPCTCGRAALDARRLLISGDVERNPGPQVRGAQWNSGGLSRAKSFVVERKLHEDMVLFCPLQEARLAPAGCAALKIGGCQHVGQARTPHDGTVLILVRDGVGVEVGVLEKKVPERATVTQAFGQCESHDHIGALPQEGRRFQRVPGHLAGSKRAFGSRSGRELTPSVVGSVAAELRQGSVHSRLVRAERPVDCQHRISHQAAAGHGSTVVTGSGVVKRLRDI
ncbi:hypothetical protein TRVL_08657 [Trypanosoma vivax]|nr:hypothetical protein TRVL_08657 [Trypanosoma vivax]